MGGVGVGGPVGAVRWGGVGGHVLEPLEHFNFQVGVGRWRRGGAGLGNQGRRTGRVQELFVECGRWGRAGHSRKEPSEWPTTGSAD